MFPLVYEINTRVWLKEISTRLGRPATLDDVPAEELQILLDGKFTHVWLMGVWKPSRYSAAIAGSHRGLRPELLDHLKDLQPEDIVSSPYSIPAYEVSEAIGGHDALVAFRKRLAEMGVRLMLDFVPNHMALDNRWLPEHPELFVSVSRHEQCHDPASCFEYTRGKYLAHGKDPYFPSWTDTLQLNYANPATHEMMIHNLSHISDLCDGVRCDVAMLILKDVFNTTWENLAGKMTEEFWPKAIEAIRKKHPKFLFLAESYWNREWELQQMGFDFTYDKPFYDYLGASPVNVPKLKGHLLADWNYQKRLCRFIENHDEVRASERFGPNHAVAALVMLTSPGLDLIHQGQLLGLKKKIPVQLIRHSKEPSHKALLHLYLKLFAFRGEAVFQEGHTEWLELNSNGQSLCFGYSRTIPGVRAFVLANFSATGIDTRFSHPALAGLNDQAVTAFSTRFPEHPHERQLNDATLSIRLAPHEGVLLMAKTG
ncbi:alpha-amylase [Chlorobaculum limnaeum]|uniref:Alpha-amylase n=1 Tax=Chlorobaculum limnaeum TaxID=274537 RepID=A0A1D8CVR1_CHLLM|nr:alpha-amylase family glycosyl hydrolase [Chlorobaculum limnaeum]AOS82960.1 alpha-amylase [Chlorobaculum limnaeum]